ncbi:putative ankyrin repeat protein [Phytophthora citrophthora]|uniref:Ankyrin repeat protein n=1 Tax=Phytophthora citrophthora TaxID=4793 RepID=A0AAD9LDZ2_9STRA|nr:putative ankyrin repeat protein [Phytophthora citrophthora]
MSLTAVNLALKAFPAVAALRHVGSIISSYLDGSVLIPLDQACLMGSTRLLDRIWQNSNPETERSTIWSLCSYLRTDIHYYRFQFTKSLRVAVKHGDLGIVKWILGHLSGCTAEEGVVEDAALCGRMEILQYLLEYGRYEEQDDGKRNTILWGGDDMANAIKEGHAEVAHWLYENTRDVPRNLDRVMEFAVQQGDMNLVQWLLDVVYEEADSFLPSPSINAAAGSHLEMLQWVFEHFPTGDSESALQRAAKNGRLDMVQWLVEKGITTGTRYAVEEACEQGHLDVVQWLLERGDVSYPHSAMKLAVENGHLDIVKYLCEIDLACKPKRMMLSAALFGHLHVIQWLLEKYDNQLFPWIDPSTATTPSNRTQRSSQSAMDKAAGNGHFHIVKFLHELAVEMQAKGESGYPTCTTWAPTLAAMMGHLEIAKWLRENYPALGFSPSTSSMTARNGNLKMLQWLHYEQNAEWSTEAMDSAAENGHLEVVKWLHENRDEGCTMKAMTCAARNGHLKVLRWLQLNRSEGFTADAMEFAVAREHFEVLLFLRAHGLEECSSIAKLYASHKQPHVKAWLEVQYPDSGL